MSFKLTSVFFFLLLCSSAYAIPPPGVVRQTTDLIQTCSGGNCVWVAQQTTVYEDNRVNVERHEVTRPDPVNDRLLQAAQRSYETRAADTQRQAEDAQDNLDAAREAEQRVQERLRMLERQQIIDAAVMANRHSTEQDLQRRQAATRNAEQQAQTIQSQLHEQRIGAILAESLAIEQTLSNLTPSNEPAQKAKTWAQQAIDEARILSQNDKADDAAIDILSFSSGFRDLITRENIAELTHLSTQFGQRLVQYRAAVTRQYVQQATQRLTQPEVLAHIDPAGLELLNRELRRANAIADATEHYDFVHSGFNVGIDLLSQLGREMALTVFDFTFGFAQGTMAPFNSAAQLLESMVRHPSRTMERLVRGFMDTISRPDEFWRYAGDASFRFMLRTSASAAPSEQGRAWGEFASNLIIGIFSGGSASNLLPEAIVPAVAELEESAVASALGRRAHEAIQSDTALSSMLRSAEPFFEESLEAASPARVPSRRYTAEAAHQRFRAFDIQPYMPNTHVMEFETRSSTRFLRLHLAANPFGTWLARSEEVIGLTPRQLQQKFSLPAIPTHVSEVIVPEITTLRVSRVNGIFNGRAGAIQYELGSEIPINCFRNTRVIGEVATWPN